MVSFKHRGNFNNAERFLRRNKRLDLQKILNYYGLKGVEALKEATPQDTGATSEAWGFTTSSSRKASIISWTNSNVQDGVPIVILLHYGHATATGGYVQGREYINSAIRPIFDQIADAAWREVTKI
jgi:hypothetical protein